MIKRIKEFFGRHKKGIKAIFWCAVMVVIGVLSYMAGHTKGVSDVTIRTTESVGPGVSVSTFNDGTKIVTDFNTMTAKVYPFGYECKIEETWHEE